MTLGRRLIVTNAALIAAIAMVGAVALWGVLAMRSDIQALMYEHQELRLIDEVSTHVAEVLGALRVDFPDREFILPLLSKAIVRTEALRDLQAGDVHHTSDHAEHERELIARTLTGLEAMKGRLENRVYVLPDWNHESSMAKATAILDDIKALAAETHTAVHTTRLEATANVRWTLLITLSICSALIVAAIVLGLAQYHLVMRPLRRLRAGVRRVADGRFGHVLTVDGDREFVDLAGDFNRMAGELQSLYKNLEDKVAQKSRELVRSERLASVGFLAAGVAHEINNPLGIISTYAELSLKDLEPVQSNPAVAEAMRSLRVMHKEAFRCKAIIEKLLSLSKRDEDSRGPVDLAKVAQDVVAMVSRLGKYKYRGVTVELDEINGVTVIGNESEIKQVLLNLVVNALEAVETGGQVRLQARHTEDHVELSVIDNGCGMSAQTQEHVFEPFFSRKHGNGEHGLGLGLSICHAIIESHRGRITARSDGPGKGSRFMIQLPRPKVATST